MVLEPGLYLAAGAVMGFVGGWLFYRLWRGLLPRSCGRKFWRSLLVNMRGMLTSNEPPDLFRHYRILVVATACYAGRNTLAVVVGIVPNAMIFLLLDTLDPSGHVAASVAVHPATAIARPAGLMSNWRVDGERLLIDRGKLGDSPVQLAGQTLDREALAKKQAFCETTVSCLLLDIMLFETHSIDPQAESQEATAIVVRPVLLDSNPFWPYLNDFDFWFFIAVMSGSAAAAWRSRHRRIDQP